MLAVRHAHAREDDERRRGPKQNDALDMTIAARARANDAVTTVTGKEGTQEAGKRCLVFSPFILEAEGGDGSRRSAKERCE